MTSEEEEEAIESRPMTNQNHLKLEAKRPTCCCRFCRYLSTRHHPLPPEPSLLQRLAFAFRCPTHGYVGWFLTGLTAILCLYGITLVLVGPHLGLPGRCEKAALAPNVSEGNASSAALERRLAGVGVECSGQVFGLFALFVCAMVGGMAVSKVLPPLLGMMVVGFLLQNVPYIDVARTINPLHSSLLRNVALCIILVRAGLGLDPVTLRRLSCAVFRLAFTPCLTEASVVGVMSYFLLKMPFQWGFMLGFVLAAVSPAVVVPCMLRLEERRLGTNKGIPTLVIAAASVDDVLAITGFGVMAAVTFSESELVLTLFRGPLEALLGVVYGLVVGPLMWCLPYKKSSHHVLFRFLLLFGAGLFALLGSTTAKVPGAGALGCLTVAFVAGIGWRRFDGWNDDKNPLNFVFAELWWIAQPFLFGLIGAEIKLENLEPNSIAWGILTLFIGLAFRMVASFLVVLGTGLNLRERIFISLAWLPKATVQAAIGPLALDTAIRLRRYDVVPLGLTILTCAVLSILITAPIGAFLIDLTAPRLLHQERRDLIEPANEDVEEEKI